ncbi:MAG: hypothetical protein DKM50_05530 [Candidatus Margulisiibacteriota bacterium]|nr:MAG: hypothetical protein DKM50_05530 [Candidatus Margulisiibacteriota bacterium]
MCASCFYFDTRTGSGCIYTCCATNWHYYTHFCLRKYINDLQRTKHHRKRHSRNPYNPACPQLEIHSWRESGALWQTATRCVR